MKAWVIERVTNVLEDEEPLKLVELPDPKIGEKEILVRVCACGVCHTEIDEIEGRVLPTFYPIVPGHQIVGEVVEIGEEVKNFKPGDRVGVGWIYHSCEKCDYCRRGLENLCSEFKATGKDVNGGYAEYFKVREGFAVPIPQGFRYEEVAPLLCAGAIGYRALKLASPKDGDYIGLIGFGASGHLVLKFIQALFPGAKVFVFSRTEAERKLALALGAFWAGNIGEEPPKLLNCAIDTTPVWRPPLATLKFLKPGGRLIINAIRKEETDKQELLSLEYHRDLWLEKEIKTVANVTRKDILELFQIVQTFGIKPEYEVYPFSMANQALRDIKQRKIRGAKVLKIVEG